MSGAEFQRMAHRALEQLGDAAKLCLERDVGAACQPFLQQAVEGVAADVADELAVDGPADGGAAGASDAAEGGE